MALPTIAIGAGSTAVAITNATDVAGNLSITTKVTAGIAATITFGYAYNDIGGGLSAAQIIITPTNAAAALDMNKIYVSSTTTTTFDLSIKAGCAASAHTYTYHIIETQAGNGSGSFPGLSYGGVPAWASAVVTQGTDVAGGITRPMKTTTGSVTFTSGDPY